MGGLGLAFLLAAAQEGGRCGSCHEKEARAEAASPHAACADCHGGHPREAEKERAHAAPFAGRFARAKVPELCARCHADVRRMNVTGLPTDQYAQYVTSKHGEALARGHEAAAVCTDCHGTHGIRPGRDAASPVHPLNVPATCGRCHSDAELMKRFGHRSDAEALYASSVHAALLRKGDLSAPHCATCHGNHGAVPPGFGRAAEVCGKCHLRPREFFEKSPHAFYAKDGSFNGCVACHSNHKIAVSAHEILGRCAPCHERGDKEMEKGRALQALVEGTRSRLRSVRERERSLARAGFHTGDEEFLLEQRRTSGLQLPLLLHQLDLEALRDEAAQEAAALDAIDRRLGDKERERRARRLALLPIGLFLVTLAGLFRVKARRLEGAGGAP